MAVDKRIKDLNDPDLPKKRPTENRRTFRDANKNFDEFDQHRHTGSDSQRVSYNDLLDLPEITPSVVSAPSNMLIHSNNATINSFYTTFAFNADWTRMILPAGNGAGQLAVYKNPNGDKTAEFWHIAAPAQTPTGFCGICYFAPTDKFIVGEFGTSNLFSRNNDDSASSETVLSISGTGVTNITGIATDGTLIYIYDGGTDTVRTYTLSGNTLTFVSTITLADANTKAWIVVDDQYIRAYGTALKTFFKYDKVTGALIAQQQVRLDTGARNLGLGIDPDGVIRQLVAYANNSNAVDWFYLSKIPF